MGAHFFHNSKRLCTLPVVLINSIFSVCGGESVCSQQWTK